MRSLSHEIHPAPKLGLSEALLPGLKLELGVGRALIGEVKLGPELVLGSSTGTL